MENTAMKIDPILLSVYARTFKSITDEMSISMEKTTRSPILCEAKDYVTGLYDAEGRMLEQTENLPILAFSTCSAWGTRTTTSRCTSRSSTRASSSRGPR
jgi:N-methylhydantoinase B/oxoprolinase/acetone carboxylase alpha subunit